LAKYFFNTPHAFKKIGEKQPGQMQFGEMHHTLILRINFEYVIYYLLLIIDYLFLLINTLYYYLLLIINYLLLII